MPVSTHRLAWAEPQVQGSDSPPLRVVLCMEPRVTLTVDDIIIEPSVWPMPDPVHVDVTEGGLLGIPLHRLNWPLQQTVGEAQVENPIRRFYARFPKFVDEEKCTDHSPEDWWKYGRHHIPYPAMAAVFTPDELTRIMWSEHTQNSVDDHFCDRDQESPYDHVLWKIRHSIYMWGMSDKYNTFVSFYEGLQRLSFGAGFEVRLDHTDSINERGTAVYTRNAPPKPIWLDGEFGLLVYYKGKHVLTVGFSATGAGVLLHQVQLREKKGNRFLYKLPCSYLEHTINCFHAAFHDLPILLIDGQEAVERVRRVYGSRASTDFDPTDAPARIQALYDQPLNGYKRVPVEKGVYAKCYQVAA